MATEVLNVSCCNECRHVSSTGAFTAGGAKACCDHDRTCATRGSNCFNRVIPDPTKIPAWCPLQSASKPEAKEKPKNLTIYLEGGQVLQAGTKNVVSESLATAIAQTNDYPCAEAFAKQYDKQTLVLDGEDFDIIDKVVAETSTTTIYRSSMKTGSFKIQIKNGVIFVVGNEVPVSASVADQIAKANGYHYAESFVIAKAEQELELNGSSFVIIKPEPEKSRDRFHRKAPDVTQMFAADEKTVEAKAAELAESIAIEDDVLTKMGKELSARKTKLGETKEALGSLLTQAGLSSIKLESGLSPSVKIDRKIFKASGVPDDNMFAWLRDNNLGDIIITKHQVHYQTLQSTLKVFEDGGGDLPGDLFNVSKQTTVRMNGKSKFLANRKV